MVYEWKKPLYKVKPQDVGQYLDSISQRDGGIKPSVIVEEASELEALLHTCFEWDNTEAAQKYREDQARAIVRNLVVVHFSEDRQDDPPRTRAFVHVSTQEDGGRNPRYLGIKSVLDNTQMREDLIEQAMRELKSFQAKYEGILELAELMDAINKLFVA